MNYKISPSDLTFLYEDCKACFYLKVAHNIPRPSVPLPSIFSKIATLLKDHYNGKATKELHFQIPPGFVNYGEQPVISHTISIPRHENTCFISGRFDISIIFQDKTYGVIDFKTGSPDSNYSSLYSRQLHAYAYALENPASGKLKLFPVSKLGLLYFNPSKISQNEKDWLSYDSKVHWIGIPKDEENFLSFLSQVLTLLESEKLPSHSSNCKWSEYLAACSKT